jgi:Uma2 family endonuclease
MATVQTKQTPAGGYPTSDGKPMAETDQHRILMNELIDTLDDHYAADPRVYVSGNLLVCYQPGNRRKHVAPDVFVVRGVPKQRRLNYLVWEEGRAPQVVIELTSSSTRKEDQQTKLALYRDVLKVREYFLFDPFGDYLTPRLQGYRLRGGVYRRIRAVNDRLPSQVLGLHLEPNGSDLRLWNPVTGSWLPTRAERAAQAEQARAQAEQERDQAVQELQQQLAEAQAELEQLRHQPPANGQP